MSTVAVAGAPARPGAGGAPRSWRRLVTSGPVLGIAALALWELLARTVLSGTYALAAPSEIVREIADHAGLYLRNLRHTAWNAVQGFFWGNLIGVALAAVAVVVPPLRRVVYDVALTVSCLPLVAVAPILRVVLGRGESTPVALSALAVVFTTLTATLLGLGAASPSTLDVVRAGGRGRSFALRAVRIPSAVPAMFAGFQIAAPAAFLGALVGEFTGSSSGFGLLTIRALATLQPARVWAVALLSTLVATLAYWAMGRLSHRLTPWSATTATAVADAGGSGRILTPLVRTVVSLVVVVVGWVVLLRWSGLNSYFAKGPGDVWRYLVSGTDAAAHRDVVFGALRATLGTASAGFVIGLVGALALAAVLVAVPLLGRVLLPVAIALRSVPIVATTPLLILVFGRGQVGSVVIVAVMSFFPTMVACIVAMRRCPGQVEDVMRAYHANQWSVFTRARLPACMPALAASARIAVPASILGATVAEWLATGRGMGNLMTVSANTAQYDTLWACVVVLTLAAVVAHGLVAAAESLVLGRFAPEQRA